MEPHTVVNGLHCDACSVLSVALFVQLHHGDAIVRLRRVKGVQFAHVRAQLLHGASSECITGRDQYAQPILYQPECYLKGKYPFSTFAFLFLVNLFYF